MGVGPGAVSSCLLRLDECLPALINQALAAICERMNRYLKSVLPNQLFAEQQLVEVVPIKIESELPNSITAG